jgi:hypothetical protein
MNKRIRTGIIGAAALAMATGAGPFAFAKGPSGNMNLRLNGSEVITVATVATQVNFLGIGQVISTTGGAFGGGVTFTASDTAETDVCTGTITTGDGQITAPVGAFASGTGLFTISVPMTVSESTPLCAANDSTTFALACNRTLVHKNLVSDLDAGQYHCVVTGITGNAAITGQSMEGHLDISAGANSPQS